RSRRGPGETKRDLIPEGPGTGKHIAHLPTDPPPVALPYAQRRGGAPQGRNGPGRKGQERKAQSHARSANETVCPSPTTTWSSSRISTSASASRKRSVSRRSASLGSATPDGWLWATITAPALRARQRLSTSRG